MKKVGEKCANKIWGPSLQLKFSPVKKKKENEKEKKEKEKKKKKRNRTPKKEEKNLKEDIV